MNVNWPWFHVYWLQIGGYRILLEKASDSNSQVVVLSRDVLSIDVWTDVTTKFQVHSNWQGSERALWFWSHPNSFQSEVRDCGKLIQSLKK